MIKRNWLFIIASWTGFLMMFFAMFLSVIVLKDDHGMAIVPFSEISAQMSNEEGIFPIALYNTFMIIGVVAGALSIAVMLIDELKLFTIDAKIIKIVKLSVGGLALLCALLTFIFGFCFYGTLYAKYSAMLGEFVVGGSPFVCFFGSLLLGGGVAANIFLNKEN